MSIRQDSKGRWWAYACHQGQRRSSRATSEEHARQVEHALLIELGRQFHSTQAPVDGSWEQLWKICLQYDWHDASVATVRNASLLPRELGMRNLVRNCTMATLDELVARKRAAGCGAGHIKVLLSAAKVMLTRAVRLGWIDQVPLFPEGRTLRLAEPRDLVLEPSWVEALLDQLEKGEHRSARRLMVVLDEMGLRAGEALSLEWDRVDLIDGRLQLVGTKGKRARRLPLPQPAWDALLAQHQVTGPRGSVFGLTRSPLARCFTRARDQVCKELGLGEKVRREWTLHVHRHTRLTRLAQRGWSAPQLQAWAGHSSLAITQRYVHSSAIEFEALVGRA